MLSKSEIYKKKLEREEHVYEEKKKLTTTQDIDISKQQGLVKGMDPLNQPRHLVSDCPMFIECPADGKCRNYDLSTEDCKNCILAELGHLCFKRHEMHSPDNLNRVYGNRGAVK